MSLLPDIDRILLGPGPSLTVAARDARDGGADRQPSRSADDGAARRRARAAGCGCSARAEGSFAFAVSGTGTSGMETAVANLVERRHARHRRRHRLLRRSARADVRALRRDGDAPRRRVGQGVRSGRAARRSSKRDAAPTSSAMVHAETSTGVLNPVRELAAIAREHGALTIVDAVTSLGGMPLDVGALGHRRRLQLHAEMPRRAVGAGAGRVRPARARAAREVPQLLLRSVAARGLLAAPQVSPHDVVDAGLRARTKRWRSSRKKGSRRAGRGTSATIARSLEALGGARPLACCRAKASGCGR